MNAKPCIEIQITGTSFDDMFADWATIPGEDRDDLSHWDMDAIRGEYNAELDNLAPEGVFWGWTESPFIFAPWDADRDALREAFAAATASAEEGGIDLESIAMRHKRANWHTFRTERQLR